MEVLVIDAKVPGEDTWDALFLDQSSLVLEPYLALSSTVQRGLVDTSFMKYSRPI